MKKILVLFVLPFLLLIVSFASVVSTGSSNHASDMPVDDEEYGDFENYIPSGDSDIGNGIVKSALSKCGCAYVWGAEGPDEFDCSGLVWWACKENNVNFARTTADELSRMGSGVSVSELQPGDLLCFKTDPKERVSHVGIYIGDGLMVHAPNKRTVVRVDKFFSSGYWTKTLYNCRRIY